MSDLSRRDFLKLTFGGTAATVEGIGNFAPRGRGALPDKFERRELLRFSLKNFYNRSEQLLDEEGELLVPDEKTILAYLKVHYSEYLDEAQMEKVSKTLALGFSLMEGIIQNRVYCGLNRVKNNDDYVLSDPNLSSSLKMLVKIKAWDRRFGNTQSPASPSEILQRVRDRVNERRTETEFYPDAEEGNIVMLLIKETPLNKSFLEDAKISYSDDERAGDLNPVLRENPEIARKMLAPLKLLMPETQNLDLRFNERQGFNSGKLIPGERAILAPETRPLIVLHELGGHNYNDSWESAKKINAGYSWILEIFRLHVISNIIKQMWDVVYFYINYFSADHSNLVHFLASFLQIADSDDPKTVPPDFYAITPKEISDIYNASLVCNANNIFDHVPTGEKVSSREILITTTRALEIIKRIREGLVDESELTNDQLLSINNFLSRLTSWFKHLGLGNRYADVFRGVYNFEINAVGRIITRDINVNPLDCPTMDILYFAQKISDMKPNPPELLVNQMYWYLILQIFNANYLSLQSVEDPQEFVEIYWKSLASSTQQGTKNTFEVNRILATVLNVADTYEPGFSLPQLILFATNIWVIYFSDRESLKDNTPNIYLSEELFDNYALPIVTVIHDLYYWNSNLTVGREQIKEFLQKIVKVFSQTCGISDSESWEVIKKVLELIVRVFEESMYRSGEDARYLIMSESLNFPNPVDTIEQRQEQTLKELAVIREVASWIEEFKKGQPNVPQSTQPTRDTAEFNVSNRHPLVAES